MKIKRLPFNFTIKHLPLADQLAFYIEQEKAIGDFVKHVVGNWKNAHDT